MPRQWRVRRILTAVAFTTVGLVPAVALAPTAGAVAATLVPSSTTAVLGTIPVGQVTAVELSVQNTGGSSNSVSLNAPSGGTNGTLDFFPGPAFSTMTGSCLTFDPVTGNLISNSINAGASCVLGIYMLPTHFGARADIMKFADGTSHTVQFSINASGGGDAGYYIAGAAAEAAALGDADPSLDNPGMQLNKPIKGITGTSFGDGFWLDATDGGVFTSGSATYLGSMGGTHLNKPVVGMASNPTDAGYWLVATDGGIFTFGDAHYFGSMGAQHLNQPVVNMAATSTLGSVNPPQSQGYWLVATDGGIFTFGNAPYLGSMGAHHLNQPIVAMAPTPSGMGYWLVAVPDGGIFTFGDAGYFGSLGAIHLNQPIVGMVASPTGMGYWLIAKDGGVFTFGDVPFEGSVAASGDTHIIGMTATTFPLFPPFLGSPKARSYQAGASVMAALRSGRLHLHKSHR